MIFPEEILTLIKDFMPTWKENHSRKLNQSLKKIINLISLLGRFAFNNFYND